MIQEKKRLIIFLVIIAIIGAVSTIYFVNKSRPQNMIESTLKMKLPSTSKIVNYRYNADGGYFEAKILVESKDINSLKKQLNKFFIGEHEGVIADAPNFENVCQWWDLDKNNIDAYYEISVSGKRNLIIPSPKSHQIWAFITKEKNGEQYLYIAY